MVVAGDDNTLEQMTKQLHKLVNVLQVIDLSGIAAVERELMLVKVKADSNSRGSVFDLVQVFRAKVVDVADEALTLEVVGDPGKLVALDGCGRDSGNCAHGKSCAAAGLRREHRNTQTAARADLRAGLGLNDLGLNKRVALAKLIHHIHPSMTRPSSMAAIQFGQVVEGDIELRAG